MIIRLDLNAREAAQLLTGLVAVNLEQLRQAAASGVPLPSMIGEINAGRVRYRRADPLEHWKSYRELLRDGWGDCEDLAPACVAELLLRGIYATPWVYRSNAATGTYHVILWAEPWGLLDPSRSAGMGSREL